GQESGEYEVGKSPPRKQHGKRWKFNPCFFPYSIRGRFLTSPGKPRIIPPIAIGLNRVTAMGLVCPHCHNPVDLGESPAPEEVLCAVCGSSFRLERDATTDWSAREERRTLGKYELIEAVGVGAFGTVYKAR